MRKEIYLDHLNKKEMIEIEIPTTKGSIFFFQLLFKYHLIYK